MSASSKSGGKDWKRRNARQPFRPSRRPVFPNSRQSGWGTFSAGLVASGSQKRKSDCGSVQPPLRASSAHGKVWPEDLTDVSAHTDNKEGKVCGKERVWL